MKIYDETERIGSLISSANKIVVIQADNPDADSLGSALALEEILSALNKQISLYCGVSLPQHLRFIPGWDRVGSELPSRFDLGIIVDTSSDSLLERLQASGQKAWLKTRPLIIIDHHPTAPTVDFATVTLNTAAVATAEVLYELSQQLSWPLSQTASQLLATGILADSLGLTSQAVTARTIHIVAELVEAGAQLAGIEAARRETMRRPVELVHYKGELLQRAVYHSGNRVATVVIPWEEIERYSHAYNPSMLVLDDLRLAENTDVAIAFKQYKDGKLTAKIRCNYQRGIADKLAEHFGGGGHAYASGFKITDGRALDELLPETIAKAVELLDDLATSEKP